MPMRRVRRDPHRKRVTYSYRDQIIDTYIYLGY